MVDRLVTTSVIKPATTAILVSGTNCIEKIKVEWEKDKSIAALWKDWPKIAGSPLSENCIPLTFYRGTLTVGASHPQWIQALIFNRNQHFFNTRSMSC